MSTSINKKNIQVIFKGINIEGVKIVYFIESSSKIELLDLLGIKDMNKIFIDVFCDDTVKIVLNELKEFEDHGELIIIDPEEGEVSFLDVTFRFKSISHKRDETRGLIWLRFITMIRPKRL